MSDADWLLSPLATRPTSAHVPRAGLPVHAGLVFTSTPSAQKSPAHTPGRVEQGMALPVSPPWRWATAAQHGIGVSSPLCFFVFSDRRLLHVNLIQQQPSTIRTNRHRFAQSGFREVWAKACSRRRGETTRCKLGAAISRGIAIGARLLIPTCPDRRLPRPVFAGHRCQRSGRPQ